jgi:aryl-alcohol dehydrogenase-like predicted oxidoreductase
MKPEIAMPLVLGGHTFIHQLGNDPAASPDEQVAIVEACLNQGITWIDTTYQPERIALGSVLEKLGRRDEAKIIAWNFFTPFEPGDPVGTADYYQPGHIDVTLEQLRTSYVDCLIVHALDDPEANRRQEALAIEWRTKGYVRALGLWSPSPNTTESYRGANPYDCVMCPVNVTTGDVKGALAEYENIGWEIFATSPFFRGWELDRMVERAQSLESDGESDLRSKLADRMLRYSLFYPHVDRVVVAMRRPDWVQRNIQSVQRGPLTSEELVWLERLRPPTRTGWRARLLDRLGLGRH